jgi:hypothetical protein
MRHSFTNLGNGRVADQLDTIRKHIAVDRELSRYKCLNEDQARLLA